MARPAGFSTTRLGEHPDSPRRTSAATAAPRTVSRGKGRRLRSRRLTSLRRAHLRPGDDVFHLPHTADHGSIVGNPRADGMVLVFGGVAKRLVSPTSTSPSGQ